MGEDLFGDDISELWGAPGEAVIQPASPRRQPSDGQDGKVSALEREVERLREALEELHAAAARGRHLDVLLEVVSELDRRQAEAESEMQRRLAGIETRLLARVGEVDRALRVVFEQVESREERHTWGVLRELEATINRQLSRARNSTRYSWLAPRSTSGPPTPVSHVSVPPLAPALARVIDPGQDNERVMRRLAELAAVGGDDEADAPGPVRHGALG